MPYGLRAAMGYMRVGVHLHDCGTAWADNLATVSAEALCRWFGRAFVEPGLAEAIAPAPHTNSAEWRLYEQGDDAMRALEDHRRSLADLQTALGYRILSSVEAQMVPLRPGVSQSLRYVLDLPDETVAAHDCVMASVQAQPVVTQKDLGHVRAMCYAALANRRVRWISHIDRYVAHLPFPDRMFLAMAREWRTAIGLNENYFATKSLLQPGRPIRASWGSLVDGEVLLTPEEFDAMRGTRPEEYDDYRWSHLIAMMGRLRTPMVAEFDWHLPTSPGGVNLETGELGPVAAQRLERFGNYLTLREVPLELVVTSSLNRFERFISV